MRRTPLLAARLAAALAFSPPPAACAAPPDAQPPADAASAAGPSAAGPAAAGAPSADSLHAAAEGVAGDLMANIAPAARATPTGRLRIAVRPFRADEVANLATAEQLNNEVEAALKHAGGDLVEIMTRAQLKSVWDEVQEFSGNDPNDRFRRLTRDAGADVLVLGSMRSVTGGYSVEYRAIDVREASTGAALAFTRAPRLLPAAIAAPTALSLNDAVFDAARSLARQLVAVSRIPSDVPVITYSGDRSDMAEMLLDQLENRLREQIPVARQNAAGAQAYTGQAPVDTGPAEIVISARPIERERWVEVRFEAQTKDSGRPTRVTEDIVKADPAFGGMLPLDRNRPFAATAEALIKGALDGDAATRAARALARARVIAQKTNPLLDDTPVMVGSLTDGAIAMQAISNGLTSDEQWTTDRHDPTRVIVTLRATVKAVGGGDAPRVTPEISAPVVTSGKPFQLTLTSNATAQVAVFDWTSDDLVLRAYPYAGHPPVVVVPGHALTLPRKGEEPFASSLRPGVSADVEALIVVASSRPLDYDRIAQEPAPTVEESLKRAVPIADVFDALSKLPGNISVSIVPYQLVSPK